MRRRWIQRWRRLLGTASAGEATVSTVILWPVVLLLIWLITQAAFVYFGRSIALAAAEQGAQTARLQPVSTARGQQAAAQFLEAAGSGLLLTPHVEATTGQATVRVQVDASAVSLLPGLRLTIHQESVQPLEQLSPPPR